MRKTQKVQRKSKTKRLHRGGVVRPNKTSKLYTTPKRLQGFSLALPSIFAPIVKQNVNYNRVQKYAKYNVPIEEIINIFEKLGNTSYDHPEFEDDTNMTIQKLLRDIYADIRNIGFQVKIPEKIPDFMWYFISYNDTNNVNVNVNNATSALQNVSVSGFVAQKPIEEEKSITEKEKEVYLKGIQYAKDKFLTASPEQKEIILVRLQSVLKAVKKEIQRTQEEDYKTDLKTQLLSLLSQ